MIKENVILYFNYESCENGKNARRGLRSPDNAEFLSFHVFVLQRTAKKCIKNSNARAQLAILLLILTFVNFATLPLPLLSWFSYAPFYKLDCNGQDRYFPVQLSAPDTVLQTLCNKLFLSLR